MWYADLVAECQEKDWRASTYPVEVSCCGFMSLSAKHFLRNFGFTSARVKKVLKVFGSGCKGEKRTGVMEKPCNANT